VSGASPKRVVRGSVLAVVLSLVVVRVLTTLPTLQFLVASGVTEPVAKAVSQIPTVVFVLVLVAWFGWTRRVGLTSLGLRRESLVAFLPLAIPLVAVPVLGLRYLGGDALTWLLLDAAFVAVWEEVLFRGVVLTQLRERFARARTAVLVMAGLFGAIHLTNAPLAGADTTFALVQSAFAFLGAVGMGAVVVRTGSLWPVMVAHFLLDGAERLLFDGQATAAEPALMALLLVVGALYAVVGLWMLRDPSVAGAVSERPGAVPE
jgi:membrane protease YdiL (CAAX protease family)